MIRYQHLADAWNHFFHTPETFDTIGMFRIVWGALLLISGLLMAKDARRYYCPGGVLAATRYERLYGKSRLSLFHVLPDSNVSVYLLLCVHLTSCVLVLVGLFTRISTIVCWATLVTLHHRNPCVVHSGDTVLRLLTFLLMFSHAGDAYSLDHLWRVRGPGTSEGGWSMAVDVPHGLRGASENLEIPADKGSPWALRLMQIQVSIVYFRTVFWKLRGKRWRNGTAAYYPTQVTSFSRMRLPPVLINRFWIGLATYGTLIVELALGVLVWVEPLRRPVLLAGVAMHLVLELFLNLQLFGWTMIVSFLLFVDPNTVREWINLT